MVYCIFVNDLYFHSIGFYMETPWCSESYWLFHGFSQRNSWLPSPNELLFISSDRKCDEWTHQLSNASEFPNFTVNPKDSSDFVGFTTDASNLVRRNPLSAWLLSHRRSHVTWIHWRRFYERKIDRPLLADSGKGTVRRTHGSSVCSTPNASYMVVAGNDLTSQSIQFQNLKSYKGILSFTLHSLVHHEECISNPPAPVGAKGRVFPEALAIGSFS